jgi:hypothetical protein
MTLRPNGYEVAARAAGAIVDRSIIENTVDRLPDTPPVSATDQAKAVKDNAVVLRTVRTALSMPWQCPVGRGTSNGGYAALMGFRLTARLLSVEGRTRLAAGDTRGAVQSGLDAMALGIDDVPRGGSSLPYLVGISFEAIGRRPLWPLANGLSEADARAAARRMEDIEARRVPVVDGLVQDKRDTESLYLTEFRTHNVLQFDGLVDAETPWRPTDGNSGMGARLGQFAPRLTLEMQLLSASKSDVLADYDKYMDAFIARMRLPYTAAAPWPAPPMDPINEIMIGPQNLIRIHDAGSRAQEALLTAAFALRAYRVEHGVYPATLDGLVAGGYLTQLPLDPFDPAGGPVRYRALPGDRYLLYSVGPDGKDDGGRPITADDGSPARILEVGQRGDYVVGANLK